MGAMIFMVFMLGLLSLGGFFLLLGLLFFFLRRRGRRKGTPKRRHAVLAGVFLTLGIAACALPVGDWLFLRSVNASASGSYANTGRVVEGGYQEGTFTVDGVTYERMNVTASDLCPKGDAVFSWDAGSGWGRFFGYHNRGNYYAVENTPGLDLIRDGGIWRRMWCRSDQLAQARAWYGDGANYLWYLTDDSGEEHTYTLLTPQPDGAQMAALQAVRAGEPVEFTVPAGAGPQEYGLCSISADRVAQRDEISLAVYGGQLCLAGVWNQSHTDTTRTDTAYPLPADLADALSGYLPG